MLNNLHNMHGCLVSCTPVNLLYKQGSHCQLDGELSMASNEDKVGEGKGTD